MRTKKLFFALLLALGCFSVQAQSPYKSAIGIRLGFPVSASYKHFISDAGALEAFAGFQGYSGYGWVAVGAMYQHHFPIGSIEGFHWYVGGGAAVYFWHYDFDNDFSSTNFGILGVGGVDYKFQNIPLNLSADIMPVFFIGSNLYYSSSFRAGYGGLSARYTFGG